MRDPKQPTQQSWKRLLFLHVTIASSFWGLRSFHQMLNKFKRRTPALLLREVAAYTHTCTHVRSHHSNLSSPNASCVVFSVQPALLLKVIQKGIDYKRGLTLNSLPPKKEAVKTNGPACPCGSSHLIILLKWRRAHFSLCDHRAGVAFGWAGLLAGSPPLWCVLINTTLIVPWCYFEAWKWAFFSIVSAGAIPVGNIPVLQTKSALWLALAVSDKTRHF